MLDTGPIRAHVKSVATVEIAESEIRVAAVESTEVVAFACIDHPGLLWNGAQWGEVLKHLVTGHAGTFHDGTAVSEEVQIGIEPPAGQ